MPFLVYQTSVNDDGSTDFILRKEVSLAGIHGPIYRYVKARHADNEQPIAWHMTEKDIMTNLDIDPLNHAFLVDLKPNVEKNVSLFRLTDVWGYSAAGWTPILIRLLTFFVDRIEKWSSPVFVDTWLGGFGRDLPFEFHGAHIPQC